MLSSESSWTTTHRQRLMHGENLNVLAERHAALHFKATRLQARAVDAAPRIDASNVMKTFSKMVVLTLRRHLSHRLTHPHRNHPTGYGLLGSEMSAI